MRNLFLVLVLVNLAFAAWSAWFAPLEHSGRPADEGLPALTLVSEVPVDLRSGGAVAEPAEVTAEDAPESSATDIPPAASDAAADAAAAVGEEAVAAEAPGVTAPDTRCTSIGPFRELSQAASAASTLRAAGHQPMQRVVEGDIWSGYWVYIPAIPTEQEANETLARVRKMFREAHIPTPMSFATAIAAISCPSVCSARSAASAGCATKCARSGSSPRSSIARAERRCIGSISRSRPGRRSTSIRCSRPAASSVSSNAPARRRANLISLDRGFFSEPHAAAWGMVVATLFCPRIEEQDMQSMKPTAWTLALCVLGSLLGPLAQAQDARIEQAAAHGDGALVAGPARRG